MMDSNQLDQMLYASFNQDSSCFSIGTERGFRVYNTFPFKDSFERPMDGGIGIVEMLYRCNILALVGGGKSPKYSANKVILWDDYQSKVISELRFTSVVRNVKLKKDKIIVVCDNKIYVFSFINFTNIDTIDTYENLRGIVAVSSDPKSTVLAFPDKLKGHVRVKCYDKNLTSLINAHENEIAVLALNDEGTLLGTASDKGTLIRIYKTDDGSFLHEVRRGTNKSEIYSICFSPNSDFLGCSSDRGTIHVFSLGSVHGKFDDSHQENENETPSRLDAPKNPKSFWSKILPIQYFKSERSFAQFRIPEVKSICAFGKDNRLIVISADGKYYQTSFDQKTGGECHQEKVIDLKTSSAYSK